MLKMQMLQLMRLLMICIIDFYPVHYLDVNADADASTENDLTMLIILILIILMLMIAMPS